MNHDSTMTTAIAPLAYPPERLAVGSSLSLTGILALVLVAGWLATRWLRRRGLGGANNRLQVVERLGLGSRRELLLVRIDQQQFVLGVTEQRIETITSCMASEFGAIGAVTPCEGASR